MRVRGQVECNDRVKPDDGAGAGSAGWRQAALGSAVALALTGGLAAAMVPVRSHLSVATTALVLVVPVVAGVAVGGFAGGAVGVAAGFLVYDLVFIPPYYTLSVGSAQNWVALAVYAVVMVVVAQVVAHLGAARAEAQRRARETRRLFELSELLVAERSLGELLQTIVVTARQVFDVAGVALLLPGEDGLAVAASAGDPPSADELRRLAPDAGEPVSVGTAAGAAGQPRAVALAASGRPIGMLLLRGVPTSSTDRDLLAAFANHAALAIERAQLQEQATRAELLEEVDKLRRSLVGAVSHDLRTPLATIKVATTNLLDPDVAPSPADRRELLELMDVQADRLDRLVSNLLDMTRIQSGALRVQREAVPLADLVTEALASLGSSLPAGRVGLRFRNGLPLVDVDPVLVRQVVANLVENALRHGPEDTPVTITATTEPDGRVEVAVSDSGPGVPEEERSSIFEMFNHSSTGGRAGLGLAIAESFVEAHGERIWVEGSPTGARFVFTLPASAVSAEV